METVTHKTSPLVSEAQATQYLEEGWFVLERVLSQDQLELLRRCAQAAIHRADDEMNAAGVDTVGLNHRGRRYFVSGMAEQVPALRSFLFGDLMADICRATLGPDAFQFVEQFVIKAADQNSAFSWHQDSGFVHEDHEPYLTCWIALDDVTEENGCVYLLPYSRAGIRSYVKHFDDEATHDKVGYFGDDPGIPVVVPAGSIACFSSVVFHRSGPNLTQDLRRVFLAQYSAEVIRTKDGSRAWEGFEEFLRSGERFGRRSE
jgi:ectoine hydroxylase-related dioxygenase (phytanoyl-CoA dioxygenase family)